MIDKFYNFMLKHEAKVVCFFEFILVGFVIVSFSDLVKLSKRVEVIEQKLENVVVLENAND